MAANDSDPQALSLPPRTACRNGVCQVPLTMRGHRQVLVGTAAGFAVARLAVLAAVLSSPLPAAAVSPSVVQATVTVDKAPPPIREQRGKSSETAVELQAEGSVVSSRQTRPSRRNGSTLSGSLLRTEATAMLEVPLADEPCVGSMVCKACHHQGPVPSVCSAKKTTRGTVGFECLPCGKVPADTFSLAKDLNFDSCAGIDDNKTVASKAADACDKEAIQFELEGEERKSAHVHKPVDGTTISQKEKKELPPDAPDAKANGSARDSIQGFVAAPTSEPPGDGEFPKHGTLSPIAVAGLGHAPFVPEQPKESRLAIIVIVMTVLSCCFCTCGMFYWESIHEEEHHRQLKQIAEERIASTQ